MSELVLVIGKDLNFLNTIDICTKPAITILDIVYVDLALVRMMKRNACRLVVVNTAKDVAGILTTDDLYNIKRFSEELAFNQVLMMSGRRRPN